MAPPRASCLVAALLALAASPAGALPPANDECAGAMPVGALPFSHEDWAMALATSSPADPRPSCTGGLGHHTVWFEWTAPVRQRVEVSTRTSWQTTFVWVGTGDCGSLAEVACDSPFGGGATFTAEAGVTYRFAVGTYYPETWAKLGFIVEDGPALDPPPPANDACATPIDVSALPSSFTVTGVGATEEAADLSPPCWPGARNYTLWFRYTSAVDRQVRVDTTNSTADTWVTVATGTCGRLTAIDCDWTSGVNSHGIVDFLARAGVSYRIQVSRYFPPGPGDEVLVDFTAGETDPVTVHVTDAATGDDVADAHVTLRDTFGGYYLLREGWTDARGLVTLYPAFADVYDLQVVAPLHVVHSENISAVGPLALEVALPPMTGIRAPTEDLARVAVAGERSIVTFLSDGSDERVIDLAGFSIVGDPTWSPDGTEIAFPGVDPAVGNIEIYAIGFDGSGLRRITRFNGNPEGIGELAWSPDGAQFAFVCACEFLPDPYIYTVDAVTGLGVRQHALGSDPTWSPDSSMIAYVDAWGPRAMRRDGSHVVTLDTLGATGIDWSPDGTRLALSNGNVSIWTVDINATGAREIAGADGVTSMLAPTWSPGSCEVMFTELELGIARLTTARADGTGFATDWRGGTWASADWSFSPAPVDVPGDRAPRVEMLDPDGGELLVPGVAYTVRWQADDDQGIVSQDLDLLVNGSRISIATGLPGGVESFSWTVPAEPADSSALIEVVARDAGGQEHRSTSKYGFSIAGPSDPYQTLRLTAPLGGEALRAGEVYRIAWEADRRSIFTADNFHLELSVDGGVTYRAYIDDFVPSTDRSYEWTVPDVATREAVVRIRQDGTYDESAPLGLNPEAADGAGAAGGRIVLYGVRDAARALLSWGLPAGSLANVHRADRKEDLPGLWAGVPLAVSADGGYTDPDPPPGPARPWFYQVFATGCAGESVP